MKLFNEIFVSYFDTILVNSIVDSARIIYYLIDHGSALLTFGIEKYSEYKTLTILHTLVQIQKFHNLLP
jgi:hypothetical protein